MKKRPILNWKSIFKQTFSSRSSSRLLYCSSSSADLIKTVPFVSVWLMSTAQEYTAILASSAFLTSPSMSRLKIIPFITVEANRPEPRILITRTLSMLNVFPFSGNKATAAEKQSVINQSINRTNERTIDPSINQSIHQSINWRNTLTWTASLSTWNKNKFGKKKTYCRHRWSAWTKTHPFHSACSLRMPWWPAELDPHPGDLWRFHRQSLSKINNEMKWNREITMGDWQ